MARPERNTVDYFPFLCEDGKKMFYIEETYGNDGFATFVKILRELAKTENHYLDLSKNTTLMFLSAKCKISKETLISIINDLVDLGKLDKTLWEENKVVWCQDFIDSIQDAYFKRKNKCITYDGLLLLLCSLGIRKPIKGKHKEPDNTQSIVEDSKVNKSKLFTPPLIEDVISYFLENNYSDAAAKKAFNYYQSADWVDSKGNKVKNWKQKMVGNWFKPENEINITPAGSVKKGTNQKGITYDD